MSGSDPTGPNWTRVFDSARARIFRRVLLVVGVGAAGAALLTISGFIANDTIPTPLALRNGTTDEEKPKNPQGKKPKPPKPQPPTPKNPAHPPKHHPKPKPKPKPRPKSKPECGSEPKLTDSASTEYEDCPQAKIDAAWEDEGKASSDGEVEAKSSPPDPASAQK